MRAAHVDTDRLDVDRKAGGQEEGIKEGIIAAFSTAQLIQLLCLTSADCCRSFLLSFSFSLSVFCIDFPPLSTPAAKVHVAVVAFVENSASNVNATMCNWRRARAHGHVSSLKQPKKKKR